MDYMSKQLMVFLGTPAKLGIANKPTSMQNGMNILLESQLKIFSQSGLFLIRFLYQESYFFTPKSYMILLWSNLVKTHLSQVLLVLYL